MVPRTPDESADEDEELCEEPEVRGDPGEERERCGPAAEEEGDGEAAGGEHAEVFTEEEEGEFEAGVFDVVAGDDFGFAFGQVERAAVGFGAQAAIMKRMKPAMPQGVKRYQWGKDAGVAGLRGDDVDGRERAGGHDDHDR